MKNNIDTIIFDFGGVLLNLNMQACVDAFARIGYDKIGDLLDHYKQKGIFLQYEEGKITTEDFFCGLQSIVGKQASIEDIKKAYLAFIGDIPAYKLELILRLKEQYKILMLSNINPFIFDYCKKTYFEANNHSFEDYFDKGYLSFEAGICKPDKAIFDYMVKNAKLNPQHCFFLDDGPANIEVANSMGFNTYLVKPNENFLHLFDD